MATVKKVLARDKKFRYMGVTEDLHTIDSLTSDQTLDYDMPTLCHANFANQNLLLNSKEMFKRKFNEKYPFLKNVNMKNLLIAGGSVSNIVRNYSAYNSDSDIDFFVYGLSVKKATIRIKEWILDILLPNRNSKGKCNKQSEDDFESESDSNKKKKSKKQEDFDEYKLIRNNNTLAIHLETYDAKIQIIFRLYTSISEILHGFDLGSSAVGYDGENVYFTSLGKFCHEFSCNIIDTTRRSTTYEYRLDKYFNRGFNIVLPRLDVSKLRTSYFKYSTIEICELPYFVFGYSNIIGNKIIIERFYNTFGKTSDYNLEPMDITNIYYHSLNINIINLIKDVDYFYYVSSNITMDNIDILSKPPVLNKGTITTFYDKIRKKLNKKKIDVNLLNQYFTVETTKNIVGSIFNKKIDTKQYLDDLVERQRNYAIKKLKKLLNQDHSKIKWITDNPGTQLTSSFNPIIEDENNWYGKTYYK